MRINMCLNGLFGSGKRDSPDSLGDEAAHSERLLFTVQQLLLPLPMG